MLCAFYLICLKKQWYLTHENLYNYNGLDDFDIDLGASKMTPKRASDMFGRNQQKGPSALYINILVFFELSKNTILSVSGASI